MKHSKTPGQHIGKAESHEPPKRNEADYQRFRDKHRAEKHENSQQREEEGSPKRPKR